MIAIITGVRVHDVRFPASLVGVVISTGGERLYGNLLLTIGLR